jgi:hypothetical protein
MLIPITGQPYTPEDLRALARAGLIDFTLLRSGAFRCQPTQPGITLAEPPASEDEWMTYAEASKHFKRCKRTLQAYVSRGDIPSKTGTPNDPDAKLLRVDRLRYYFS